MGGRVGVLGYIDLCPKYVWETYKKNPVCLLVFLDELAVVALVPRQEPLAGDHSASLTEIPAPTALAPSLTAPH
jgi:hypothetical protein